MRLGQRVVAIESVAESEVKSELVNLESLEIKFPETLTDVAMESRNVRLFKNRKRVNVSTEGFLDAINDLLNSIAHAIGKFFRWLFGIKSTSGGGGGSSTQLEKAEKEVKETEKVIQQNTEGTKRLKEVLEADSHTIQKVVEKEIEKRKSPEESSKKLDEMREKIKEDNAKMKKEAESYNKKAFETYMRVFIMPFIKFINSSEMKRLLFSVFGMKKLVSVNQLESFDKVLRETSKVISEAIQNKKEFTRRIEDILEINLFKRIEESKDWYTNDERGRVKARNIVTDRIGKIKDIYADCLKLGKVLNAGKFYLLDKGDVEVNISGTKLEVVDKGYYGVTYTVGTESLKKEQLRFQTMESQETEITGEFLSLISGDLIRTDARIINSLLTVISEFVGSYFFKWTFEQTNTISRVLETLERESSFSAELKAKVDKYLDELDKFKEQRVDNKNVNDSDNDFSKVSLLKDVLEIEKEVTLSLMHAILFLDRTFSGLKVVMERLLKYQLDMIREIKEEVKKYDGELSTSMHFKNVPNYL